MQLIQVCIWSVVIVTAENSTLTLPLHRPPTKQTDIQTSGRTNKQTKCPSTVSKVLRCQEKPINYNDTIFENNFFNLKCLIGINLSYSLNMVRCQQRSQNIQAPFKIKSVQCRRLDVAKCSRIQGLAVIRFISH